MKFERWLGILQQVAAGERSPEEALALLRDLTYEPVTQGPDQTFARLDHHRGLRNGVPEVVFGQGKTPEQVVAIVERLLAGEGRALVTRAGPEMAQAVQAVWPQAGYHPQARLLLLGEPASPAAEGFTAVLSGGTADLPVAEEAALTLEWLGAGVSRVYDVGVAGLHRLLDQLDLIRQARVIIAVAGMEGALPTVVAGLVSCPVIAVPTSVGYGASFEGLAALLAMMNACVPGVAVVNIDNGFGAAALAYRILKAGKCV